MPTVIWQAVSLLLALTVMFSSYIAFPTLRTAVILLLGLAVYALALLALPRKRDANEIELAGGITQAELEQTLETATHQVRQLLDLAIGREAFVVRGIANAAAAIIGEVKHDPRDLIPARAFFETHLPTALRIISGINRLNNTPNLDAELAERLQKARDALPVIERGFREQHKALVSQDLDSLQIGTKTLSQTLVGLHGAWINIPDRAEPAYAELPDQRLKDSGG